SIALLVEAAARNNVELVRFLLDNGADINCFSGPAHAGPYDHHTALQMACAWGHTDVVRLLLSRGGPALDINLSNPAGFSGVMYAVRTSNAAVLELLLKAGAKTRAFEVESETPTIITAAQQYDTDIIKLLLEHGHSVDDHDYGETALHCSVERQCRYSRGGRPPEGANESAIRLLLEYGADPDSNGGRALHAAAERGARGAAAILLEFGARTDVLNYKDQTPAEVARENKFEDLERFLESARGRDVAVWMASGRHGDPYSKVV
ncbi:ankyrin repeat-containing domain protein, partial [Trichophaea hybrida]